MFAVERLGSYISRGVYTVSGPFHPFGGAVDIIVVEQEDGSFKSTPWYVRFGKFQGILKATERVVSINVNGVDADFHMYLDRKGEAFFVREVDPAEGVSEVYPSSGDELELELDARAANWGTKKSKSYNYDANRTNLVSEFEGNNRKNLARTNSRRVRLFGLPFGRRSKKENGSQDGQAGAKVDSVSSLERAEIAADLLEVRWTTNLRTHKTRNSMSSDDKKVDSSVSSEANVALDVPRSRQSSSDDSDAQISCSVNPENSMEFTLEETYIGADLTSIRSNISDGVHSSQKIIKQNSRCEKSAVSEGNSEFSQTMEDEKTDANASSDGTTAINPNDEQENIGQCNASEEILLKTSDAHVAEDIGTSAGCSAGDGFVVDILVKKEVEEVPVEESSSVEPGESLTGFVCQQSAEHPSASISRLNSLPLVPDLEKCSSALECFGGPTLRINDKVTPPNNAEDVQFLCSDLDDSEVEKVEHSKTSLSGSEECLSRDSLGSSEDGMSGTLIFDKSSVVTCKPTEDNLVIDHPSPSFQLNSNRSTPISISKAYNDTGEEALEQVVESLPNVMFDGGDLSLDAHQPFSRSLDSTLETFKMVNNGVPVSSGLSEGLQQVAYTQFTTDMSQISEEIKNIISDPAVEVSLCRQSLFKGMGYEAAARAFNAEKLDIDKFLSLGRDVLENDELVVRIGGLYFPWDAALPIASAIGSKEEGQILEPKGMIAVGQVDNRDSEEVTEKSMNSRGGSWKIWPFSFKRSNSLQRNSTSESAPQGLNETVENTDLITPKVTKKKVRAKSPTSEQLASLNLKEGKNVVTFTFSTAMFGEQQVDARIFLWKWNARIVISDVDGTITKSDVLGQFMPLMGWDWSQTGVTHLFSAIKENGYQLLFLSARSISQAYHTRQFLFNLKQDGKALPEGPMLISPDGLFPSLYREVIRRAPHEFKIACLEDVKVLFPSDHHPFYAGFGNRETDELSYLRVGIPRGKIFTINPKGEVVVNRRVDTKSYTSLHALVHDMFPPTTLHEQEDYNSWNFWRLPPPDAII